MNKVIKAYDVNASGKLERDQVIKMLTDMDSSTPPGTPPTDDQVIKMLTYMDSSTPPGTPP